MTIDIEHEVDLAMGHLPRDVRRAFSTLTARQKQVTLMVYIHGWTMPDLAKELGIRADYVFEICEVSIKKIQKNLKLDTRCK